MTNRPAPSCTAIARTNRSVNGARAPTTAAGARMAASVNRGRRSRTVGKIHEKWARRPVTTAVNTTETRFSDVVTSGRSGYRKAT